MKRLIAIVFLISICSCSTLVNKTETFDEYCDYLNNFENDNSIVSSMDQESVKKDFMITYEKYINKSAEIDFAKFDTDLTNLLAGKKLFKVSENKSTLIVNVLDLNVNEKLDSTVLKFLTSEQLGQSLLSNLEQGMKENDQKRTIKVSSVFDCSCTILNTFYKKIEIHIGESDTQLTLETYHIDNPSK